MRPIIQRRCPLIWAVVGNCYRRSEKYLAGRKYLVGKGAEGDSVEFTVEDRAGHLPADYLKRMFEPFFTTNIDGLGLTISRSIAEALGGQLWATAETHKGTTFHLSLPISAQDINYNS